VTVIVIVAAVVVAAAAPAPNADVNALWNDSLTTPAAALTAPPHPHRSNAPHSWAAQRCHDVDVTMSGNR